MQNDQLIEKYLLGDLPEPEWEEVERQYFTDPDFLERVELIEEELIESYALGALSGEKKRKIEQNLLNTPYQKEKAKFAGLLLRSIDEAAETEVAAARPLLPRENWWDAVRGFFRFQGGLALAAPAAAVLLLVSGGLVFEIIRLRQQLEIARQEQAELRQREQDLQNTVAQQQGVIERLTGRPQIPTPGKKAEPGKENTPPPKTQFATFISPLLFTGTRAGQEGLQDLVISLDFKTVRLRLVYDGKSHLRFRAVLENADGEQLWQKGNLPANRFGSRKRIDVELPAGLFEDRTYTITLKARTSSGEEGDVGRYTFKVNRK